MNLIVSICFHKLGQWFQAIHQPILCVTRLANNQVFVGDYQHIHHHNSSHGVAKGSSPEEPKTLGGGEG